MSICGLPAQLLMGGEEGGSNSALSLDIFVAEGLDLEDFRMSIIIQIFKLFHSIY